MSTRMNFPVIVYTMILLYVGGIIGGFLITSLPLAVGGNSWILGFLISLVQAIFLSVFGFLTSRLNITTLIISGLVIFVGGLLGAYLGGFLGLTGLYLTIMVLIVQTLILSFTGYLKGGPRVKG